MGSDSEEIGAIETAWEFQTLRHAFDLEPGGGAGVNLIQVVFGDQDAGAEGVEVGDFHQIGALGEVGVAAVVEAGSEDDAGDGAGELESGGLQAKLLGLSGEAVAVLEGGAVILELKAGGTGAGIGGGILGSSFGKFGLQGDVAKRSERLAGGDRRAFADESGFQDAGNGGSNHDAAERLQLERAERGSGAR